MGHIYRLGIKCSVVFPYLRSLATITWDTLDWYDYDEDGGSVHDVIGTRCDPYTSKLIDQAMIIIIVVTQI